jgi:ATP-dependent protease Clp ATPase subunit
MRIIMTDTSEGSPADPENCSFCEKSQPQVKLIITGSKGNICDGCVDICLDVIAEYHEEHFPEKVVAFDAPARRICSLCEGVVRKSEYRVVGNEKTVCRGCITRLREAS